jgi:5-methylcytosine-specific restriction endonuclease McrA
MARLSNLSPPIGQLPPVLKRRTDAEGHSAVLEPWRTWYKLAEWQELRVRVFVRDNYTCQWKGCGLVTGQPHADHKIPHRGDRRLFFAEDNVQTLCPPHHNQAKQAEEAAERRAGGYA